MKALTLFLALAVTAFSQAYPSSSCSPAIPGGGADAVPNLVSCLAAHPHIVLTGHYTFDQTWSPLSGQVLEQDSILTASITGGPNLNGPVVRVNSKTHVILKNLQINLGPSNNVTHGVVFQSSSAATMYNRMENVFISGSTSTFLNHRCLYLQANGNNISFNRFVNNTGFGCDQGFWAESTHTGAAGTAPVWSVSRNTFDGNRTNGATTNFILGDGVVNNTVVNHHCHWKVVNGNETCIVLGTSFNTVAKRNNVQVFSDMDTNGADLIINSNGVDNRVVVFRMTGNAAVTTGPVSNSVTLY